MVLRGHFRIWCWEDNSEYGAERTFQNMVLRGQPTASQSETQYDLVRKPSTLDALTGYFTPSHVKRQRLLLQFFKCSWGWTQIASETCRILLQLLINILPSCITLVLYMYYSCTVICALPIINVTAAIQTVRLLQPDITKDSFITFCSLNRIF
jgi:hypothetical protein